MSRLINIIDESILFLNIHRGGRGGPWKWVVLRSINLKNYENFFKKFRYIFVNFNMHP